MPPANGPSLEKGDATFSLSKEDGTTSLPREHGLSPSHPEKNVPTDNEEAVMNSLLDGTVRA